MTSFIYYIVLFLAKVLDNTINTTKTILIQRNRCLLAGLTVVVSDFIYFTLIKNVLSTNSNLAILVVAIGGGVGCCIAIVLSGRFSKEKTYINVILSDNKDAMQELRDYLVQHHITNVASDCYTRDWDTKTISLTVYADTKSQSRVLDEYLDASPVKFKRLVQKV